MKRTLTKLVQLAVVAVVIVSLSFGALKAVPMTGGFDDCPNDGYNSFGECVSPTWCQRQCEFVLGWLGYCDEQNCCLCMH